MTTREYDLWSALTSGDIEDGMQTIENYLSSFDDHLTGMVSEFRGRVAEYNAETSGALTRMAC